MEQQKQNQLRRIIKLARRRVNSKYENVGWLNCRFRKALKAYVRIVEKRPPTKIVLEMANILDYAYENRKRIKEAGAAKARPRGEWERLEFDYIGYPPDLEPGKKFCAAWNCFNQLNVGRKKYCSTRCCNEQKMALKRLEDNGTLLPVSVYKSIRAESALKRHNRSEFSSEFIDNYSKSNPYDLRLIGARRKKIRPTIDSKKGSHKVRVRLNGETDETRPVVFSVSIQSGKKNVINREKYGEYYCLAE